MTIPLDKWPNDAEQCTTTARSSHSFVRKASEHLRHSGTADAEVAGECRLTFELPGVEERLVVPGEPNGIAGFFRKVRHVRFRAAGTVPGYDLDNSRSS